MCVCVCVCVFVFIYELQYMKSANNIAGTMYYILGYRVWFYMYLDQLVIIISFYKRHFFTNYLSSVKQGTGKISMIVLAGLETLFEVL